MTPVNARGTAVGRDAMMAIRRITRSDATPNIGGVKWKEIGGGRRCCRLTWYKMYQGWLEVVDLSPAKGVLVLPNQLCYIVQSAGSDWSF